MIGILGLFLAIIVLIWGAFKSIKALPLALLVSLIVAVTNGMNIYSAFAGYYVEGYIGFIRSYFLMFASATLYAKIMDDSGSAAAIAYKFLDWFGTKHTMLVLTITIAVLSYGGVNIWVVFYAVCPIIMILFRASNIPRRLCFGPVWAGACTFTMTSLPGSPSVSNLVPTNFLGTSLTSAPILGIIASVMLFGMCIVYLNWEVKRAQRNGEVFTFPAGKDISMYQVDRDQLPVAWKAFLPLICIVCIIFFCRQWITNATELVIIAMLVGSALALALNWKRLNNKKAIINDGISNAVESIAGPCSIVGFGTLVQNSGGFQALVNMLLGLNLNPYVMGGGATALLRFVCGSSSGGLQIAMQTLQDAFLSSGANMDILHRLACIWSGTLDSMPYSSATFLFFPYMGLKLREGYRPIFVTSVLIPLIVATVLTAAVIMLGL